MDLGFVQRICWMSCTHSKYDTVTPPLHRHIGDDEDVAAFRISSASGVVGHWRLGENPALQLARIPLRNLAFSAAGTSTVHGVVNRSSGLISRRRIVLEQLAFAEVRLGQRCRCCGLARAP